MIKQLITVTAFVGMMSHAYAVEMPEVVGEIKFGAAVGAQAFVDLDAGTLTFDPKVDNSVVTIGTGIFAVDQGATSTFNDIDADVIGDTLWTTPTFALIVDSYNFEVSENGNLITYFGEGHATFLESGEELPYDGSWTLSLDSSNGGASFAFSSTAIATVAEPGSVALLGLGMLALCLSRRKLAA